MVQVSGGNSIDTNIVIIIILLVIIVIIIIVIAVVASKTTKRKAYMAYDYLEGYTRMNPKQRGETLKKTITEGFKSVASKSSKEKFNKIKVPNVEELLKKYSL